MMSGGALVVGLLLSALFTVVPTALWTTLIWWCDRWEREPAGLAVGAFLWGAAPAVLLSLLAEAVLVLPAAGPGANLAGDLAAVGAVAPAVEELVKAAALVFVVLLRRTEIDGPLDGILYGALVGFGFAMTENLIYYVSSLVSGGWAVWGATVFLRGLVFGLNHAFFTALTGASIGYAREARSSFGRWAVPLLGLGAAVFVHALHNLGTALSQASVVGLLISVLNSLSGVGLVVALIGLSMRREVRVVREELAEEVGQLLTPAEYDAMVSPSGRAGLLADARRAGGPVHERRARRRMEQTMELAFRKRRLRSRGADAALAHDVARLRAELALLPPQPAT